MPSSPASWQLPPGVTRGLWDYLHDPQIACGYDEYLAGSTMTAADQAFAERHFARPGRLVDLGCGTGRLLVPFALRGFWVLGVDLSHGMLRAAGEKAELAGTPIHLVRANLVELSCLADQSFDHAACLFSTLGMIAGDAERRRVLAHVFRLLRPGGCFVLHVHNRWFNFWSRPGRWWLLKDICRSLLRRPESGDCVMPAHLGIGELTLHLFTRREALRLLRAAGFRIVEVQPLGLTGDGRLRRRWWLSGLRSYGYLIAATRER